MSRTISSPGAGVTRRQFGKQAACAGLSAALAATSTRAYAAPAQPATRDSADAAIEARYQNIIRLYGERLSEPQRQRLRKILAYNEKLLAPIRAFPLDNGEPAATVLKFYEESSASAQAQPRKTSSSQRKAKS